MLVVFSFLAALGSTLLLTPVVRMLARTTGRVSRPTEDRWHSRTTALFGGVAIYGGYIVGIVVSYVRSGGHHSGWGNLTERPGSGLVLAASLMFLTGVIDDLVKLRPTSKLVLQGLAAALLVTLGVNFPLTPWEPVNVVFTLFWFIGLTNALNLLDNMDGVASGVAGTGALFLMVLFVLQGEWVLAGIAAAVVGATLGFLPYNFRPASIFMGDSGSLFLGAHLAGLGAAYAATAGRGVPSHLAIPFLVVIIPIFDTSLVVCTRTMARYAITQGGRDHVAHRLVGMGFSESRVALLLYALTACGGFFALMMHRGVGGEGAWLGAVFIVALAAFGAYLSRLYVYPPEAARPIGRLSILLEDLLYKRRALEVLFDLIVFAVAYTGAFLLRYDATLPGAQAVLLTGTLALAVACKSASFGVFGVYRGVWHRISMVDVHRLLKASLLGSLGTVAAVVFLFPQSKLSHSIFVLDALLTVLLAVGVRASFRSFELMRYSLNGVGARTLIYGAGKGGELVLREILSNHSLGLHPVGLVDDDPMRHGRLIHGFPVLGGAESLRNLATTYGAQKVVMGTKKLSEERVAETFEVCRALGVELLQLEFQLRPVDVPLLVSKKQSA